MDGGQPGVSDRQDPLLASIRALFRQYGRQNADYLVGSGREVLPGEAIHHPPEHLGTGLFIAVSLERVGIHVEALAVELHDHLALHVRKVVPADEMCRPDR